MPKLRVAKPASDNVVNAAARAFMVLERLSRQRTIGLEDLSRDVKLAKPTVYRFLLTLQELGFARRANGDQWAMTLKLFNVGSRALDHFDLHSAARPVAEELSDDLGETVHMGVLEGDSAVYVMKIESRHTIRMFSRVGRRIPLYCTAIGKACWPMPGRRPGIRPEGRPPAAPHPQDPHHPGRALRGAGPDPGAGFRPGRRGARGGDPLHRRPGVRPYGSGHRHDLGVLARLPLRPGGGGREGRQDQGRRRADLPHPGLPGCPGDLSGSARRDFPSGAHRWNTKPPISMSRYTALALWPGRVPMPAPAR